MLTKSLLVKKRTLKILYLEAQRKGMWMCW